MQETVWPQRLTISANLVLYSVSKICSFLFIRRIILSASDIFFNDSIFYKVFTVMIVEFSFNLCFKKSAKDESSNLTSWRKFLCLKGLNQFYFNGHRGRFLLV